jgi:hypothetical protein
MNFSIALLPSALDYSALFTAVLYFSIYFALLLCTSPRPSLHVLERIYDNPSYPHNAISLHISTPNISLGNTPNIR